MGNKETLQKIKSFMDEGQDQSPNNLFSLFDNKDTPFKDQLLLVFSTLPYNQAQQVYKLFQAMPDVKEAWTKSLETRLEKQNVEVDHLNQQISSLDKDLNELLEKYTFLHSSHSDFKETLEFIVKKQKEIHFSPDDISTDAEAELLEKSNEMIGLAQKALKKD